MSPELAHTLATRRKTLIVFSSPWCAPCRTLSKCLDGELAADSPIQRVHIDITADPVSAQAFRVHAVPTLVAIIDGEVVHRSTGVSGSYDLRKLLRKLAETKAPTA